jgi:magnesium transporter
VVVVVVDSAVYVDGRRRAEPESLGAAYQMIRVHSGMGWIGLHRPDEAEFMSVAGEFGIHALAVEDTMNGHQRPKLVRYDDLLFTVLRPARYDESSDHVTFGEMHVFTGTDLSWR